MRSNKSLDHPHCHLFGKCILRSKSPRPWIRRPTCICNTLHNLWERLPGQFPPIQEQVSATEGRNEPEIDRSAWASFSSQQLPCFGQTQLPLPSREDQERPRERQSKTNKIPSRCAAWELCYQLRVAVTLLDSLASKQSNRPSIPIQGSLHLHSKTHHFWREKGSSRCSSLT